MADPIKIPLTVSEPSTVPLNLQTGILPKIIEGISPEVSLQETDDGVVMTVTDKTGTGTALIPKGDPGQQGEPGEPGQPGNDGVSPTISVTDITGGHRVTITDATGSYSFDVMDGETGGISDIQVNGTSVVTDGVANVPIASEQTLGVIKLTPVFYINNGAVQMRAPGDSMIQSGSQSDRVVLLNAQHKSTFFGLAKAAGADMKNVSSATVGVYPEAQKSAISQMLSAPVTVSGTTPSITAMAGVRYICGECATLDITVPASGDVEIIFDSGSTATVLTVTPPTGVTAVKWANGFDPTALDANTRYDIIITDGEWGLAASWA